MIEDFVDSAIIIDDSESEIEELRKLLERKDIWTQHYLPTGLSQKKFKNRRIIFIDLFLDDTKSLETNISGIRKILTDCCGKEFGAYGIVLWTKHDDKISEFIKRVEKDEQKYSLPLFILSLDKSKYLREGNYDNLFNDLNAIIDNNFGAKFFINWFSLVNRGKDKTITSLYSLVPNYERQNDNLLYLVFLLGKNYTGMHLDQISNYSWDVDAIKVLNTIMNYDIANSAFSNEELTSKPSSEIFFIGENEKYKKSVDGKYYFEGDWLDLSDKEIQSKSDAKIGKLNAHIDNVLSRLNKKMMIDDVNVDQSKIIPGNVYLVEDRNSLFISENKLSKSIPIIVELTPPCDYSNNKNKYPKIMSGFIAELSKNNFRELKSEHYYKEVWPICLDDSGELKLLAFDYRYTGIVNGDELKDVNKYKLLFRVQEKLFADILQKYSAFNSRLGLSILH